MNEKKYVPFGMVLLKNGMWVKIPKQPKAKKTNPPRPPKDADAWQLFTHLDGSDEAARMMSKYIIEMGDGMIGEMSRSDTWLEKREALHRWYAKYKKKIEKYSKFGALDTEPLTKAVTYLHRLAKHNGVNVEVPYHAQNPL